MPQRAVDMPVSSAILKIMHAKLQKQKEKSFYRESFEDIMRCIYPDEKTLVRDYDLEFACVELLQNAADHVRPVLEKSAKKNSRRIAEISSTVSTIKFSLRDEEVLKVRLLEDGFSITQVGLPLSLDATGTGTRSKRGNKEGTGGFGDGLKTGAENIVRFGGVLEFVFDNYGAYVGDQPEDDRMTWTWKVAVPPRKEEPHLVCDIRSSKRPSESKASAIPTMKTKVTTSISEDVPAIHRAMISALSRFSWLIYEIEDDEKVISDKAYGAWRRTCNFKPAVSTLGGIDIAIPAGPVIEVGGLFYPMQGGTINGPHNLVVCIRGRGMPRDSYPVFTNQLREPNFECIRRAFGRQFEGFHKSMSEDRTPLCRAFKPLLIGGSSILMSNGQTLGNLVQTLMFYPYHKMIKDMLLYQKLKKTHPNDSKSELMQKVENTVIASAFTERKARYLQVLNNNGGVVKVDASVANMTLFGADQIEWIESKAVTNLRAEICKDNGIAASIDSDLRPAIDFIAGSELRIYRVRKPVDDDIEPYTFRSALTNTIVYYQPFENLVDAVKELNSYYVNSKEEKDRSTQFYMQFFSNKLRVLSIEQRVKKSIQNAKEHVKFDIGGSPKKRKLQESDSDSDSDSSDQEVLMGSRVPKAAAPVAKKLRPTVTEVNMATSSMAKLVAPPANLRTLAGDSAGGSKERHAEEPECTECVSQKFVDELGIWVPEGVVFEKPDNLGELIDIFNQAESVVRSSFNTGRAQFYPSYSPNADWRGMHYPNGTCLINVALVKDKSDMVGTMCHEVSHEYAGPHDVRFARYMQAHLTKVVEMLLTK